MVRIGFEKQLYEVRKKVKTNLLNFNLGEKKTEKKINRVSASQILHN